MKPLSRTFLFTVVVLCFSCGNKDENTEAVVRPVRYQEVKYLGNENARTFSGTSRTDKIINLSFRSSGILTEFDLKMGQKVKKGQLLGKLDNVQARLSYEQAMTNVNSAESQMNTAKLSLDRVRSLYEKGSSSLSDFENAKNGYKTAQEAYNSAMRGLAIQQEQINFGYVYAPEDGTISNISAEVDENISPGKVIATLNSGTEMEIALGLPESVINQVSVGMEAKVTLSSLENKIFTGKVSAVSPAPDSDSATYPIRVTLDDPTEDVKSGMAANVTFNFGNSNGTNNSVLVVPSYAVGEDSMGNYVFLIDDNENKSVVKKQRIKIGKLTNQGFEIQEGLSAGQKIATAGLQTLLDGQEVKLN